MNLINIKFRNEQGRKQKKRFKIHWNCLIDDYALP